VFNQYHAKKQELYNSDKTKLSYKECSNDMTTLKKETEWLNEVDTSALQSALKNLMPRTKTFSIEYEKVKKKRVFQSSKVRKIRINHTLRNIPTAI